MSSLINILHMPKKERMKNSITAIRNAIEHIDDEIEELAWAVVRQAILDIGWTSKSKAKRFNGTVGYAVDRRYDSRRDIKQGELELWLDILNIKYGFVKKILKHYKLI